MNIVYYEGAFLPEHEAKIPISDRGFLFGDGAYATIQVREGFPLFLKTHLVRLREQCLTFGLLIPEIDPSFVFELIRLNKAYQGIWRLKIIATGGDDPSNTLPFREGRIIMILKPFEVPARKPLKLGFFPLPISTCHSSFKSLAHLNRLYVMQKAKERGLDDCVSLTEAGLVLEASFGNLFWIEDKTFYTPCKSLPLYFGVTLTNAIQIARDFGYKIEYIKKSWKELPQNAFYFRSNSMGGIRPIIQIESSQYPYEEQLDQKIHQAYEELILKEKAAHR